MQMQLYRPFLRLFGIPDEGVDRPPSAGFPEEPLSLAAADGELAGAKHRPLSAPAAGPKKASGGACESALRPSSASKNAGGVLSMEAAFKLASARLTEVCGE